MFDLLNTLNTYPLITLDVSKSNLVFDTTTSLNANNAFYHSLPVVKLSYPEPFVASASFMHYDL